MYTLFSLNRWEFKINDKGNRAVYMYITKEMIKIYSIVPVYQQ